MSNQNNNPMVFGNITYIIKKEWNPWFDYTSCFGIWEGVGNMYSALVSICLSQFVYDCFH